jgi:hypothetical protein
MGEITSDWVAFDDRPVAVAFFQRIRQLHGTGTAFDPKFHLGLRVIAINRHLFHIRVEGLQVERSLMRQMGLNGGTDGILGRLRFRLRRSRVALTAKDEACYGRQQNKAFHFPASSNIPA